MPSDYRYVVGQKNYAAAGFTTPAGPPSNGTNSDTMTFDDGVGTVATNPSTWVAVNFATFTVTPGCGIDAGAASDPVRFDVAGLFSFSGKGRIWYIGGGTTTGVWANFLWQPTNGASGYISNVSITGTAYIYAGYCEFASTAALADVEVANASCLVKEHASDVLANVVVRADGVLEVRRRINGTTLIEDGGELIVDVDDNTTISGVITLGGPRAVLTHKKGKISVKGSGTYDYSRLEKNFAVTITDTEQLTEKVGKVAPTFTRTTVGRGSTKSTA